jgi:hypothetical protein
MRSIRLAYLWIGLLVAAANDQAVVLGAEDGLGSPCGAGGLAHKITNNGIAVAGLTAVRQNRCRGLLSPSSVAPIRSLISASCFVGSQ